MIGRGRALGAALFTAGALWHPPANAADPARSPADARSSSVDIYVDGSPAAVERMRVAAAETFGRAGLHALVSSSADESLAAGRAKPLARAYVDLRNPLAPRVVVVDGQSERELTRRTLQENASLETSIEGATLVLYMVVETLVTSSNASSATTPSAPSPPTSSAPATNTEPRPPASPSRREPADPAAPGDEALAPLPPAPSRRSTPAERVQDEPPESNATPSSIDLQAGLFLRTTTLDAEHPLAGAGISIELFGRHPDLEFGAVFLGAAYLSASSEVGDARASIETYSFRLLPALRVPFSSTLSAVVGVGGGLDSFSIDAYGAGVPASQASSSSAVDGIVSALVGMRLRLAERLHVNVNAGADVDVSPRTFVAQAGPERRVLLELGRVRPSLSLGFALGLTSEPQPSRVASTR